MVTVFPHGAAWTDCVGDNWLTIGRHIGCCLHFQTRTTTTSTGALLEAPSDFALDTTTTTTRTTPPCLGAPLASATASGIEVRVVFALPGTRCRSVIWHTSQPVCQALWPLLADFAQHLPSNTSPPVRVAHRFVRDEAGRPVLLCTVEHPDFICSCNVWIYVQDGTFCNFRLVALDRRVSAASFRRTHCLSHMSWDLLLNGARAADFPRWHDAALVVLTSDWRNAVTEPLSSLFPSSCDLHFLQFPVSVPASLRRAAASGSAACSDFFRELANEFDRLAQFNGYLPDARYVSIACPDHGLCRLRLVHQLVPTIPVLRGLVGEVWPWLERADVLDCQELIDDGCLFIAQYTRSPHAAWFCSMQGGTDVVFVPFGLHPCACIPCPLGHLHVARHEGAFGFLQHRSGSPVLERLFGWHDVAAQAWNHAEGYSTSSEERRLLDGANMSDSDASSVSAAAVPCSDAPSNEVVTFPRSGSHHVMASSLPHGLLAAVVDDVPAPSGTSLLQVAAHARHAFSVPAVAIASDDCKDVLGSCLDDMAVTCIAPGPHAKLSAQCAGLGDIPTPCRSQSLDVVADAEDATCTPLALAPDEVADVATGIPVPIVLAECLPSLPSVDSMRCLLRSILVPWLQGWTRDVDGLDLPHSLQQHFLSAPVPFDAPVAFWIFTDGSSTEKGAGCGNVLIVEHSDGSAHRWSYLGWCGHALAAHCTNNDAESAGLRLAATWALGVAWCVPTFLACDSQIALASAQGFSQVLNSHLPCSVHRDARYVFQIHEQGASMLACRWIPSHQGTAANELADAVARFYAQPPAPGSLVAAPVWDFWQHPLLPWTWALFNGDGLPDLGSLLGGRGEPVDPLQSSHVQAVVKEVRPQTTGRPLCHLRLCTAKRLLFAGQVSVLESPAGSASFGCLCHTGDPCSLLLLPRYRGLG